MTVEQLAVPMVFSIPPDDVAPYGAISDRDSMLMRIAAKWAMYAVAIQACGLLEHLAAHQAVLDEQREALDEKYHQMMAELKAEVARAEYRGLKEGLSTAKQQSVVQVDVDGFKDMVREVLHSPSAAALQGQREESVLRKVVRAEVLEAVASFSPEFKFDWPAPASDPDAAQYKALYDNVMKLPVGTQLVRTKDGLEEVDY